MPEGEVRIRISARDDATGAMNSVRKAVTDLVKAWLGFQGVKRVVQEFQDVIKDFVEYTSTIDKANKITGIATDTLQRLAYAAEQEGTSLDTVNNALKFLLRNMANVRDGSVESKKAFDDIGVSATNVDGTLRSVEDVFYEVAEAIRTATSDEEAMNIATKLFGKTGTEVIPLAKIGAQGLKDWGDEAERLHIILTNKTIVAGEALGDQLTRINAEIKAVRLSVAEDLVPALDMILPHITNLAEVYKKVAGVYEPLLNFAAKLWAASKPAAEQYEDWLEAFKKHLIETSVVVKDLAAEEEKAAKARAAAQKAWLNEMITLDEFLAEIEERDTLKQTRAAFFEMLKPVERINEVLPKIREEMTGLEVDMRPFRDRMLDFADGIEDVSDKLDTSMTAWQQFSGQLYLDLQQLKLRFAEAFSGTIASALTDFVVDGKAAWADYARAFIRDITQMIIKALVFRAIMTALFPAQSGLISLRGGGPVRKMQGGGEIPGGPPYTDRVLIAGMPGEGMLNRVGMATLGREGLDRLNRGQDIRNEFGVKIYIQGSADENTVRSMERMLRQKLPAMVNDARRRRQI